MGPGVRASRSPRVCRSGCAGGPGAISGPCSMGYSPRDPPRPPVFAPPCVVPTGTRRPRGGVPQTTGRSPSPTLTPRDAEQRKSADLLQSSPTLSSHLNPRGQREGSISPRVGPWKASQARTGAGLGWAGGRGGSQAPSPSPALKAHLRVAPRPPLDWVMMGPMLAPPIGSASSPLQAGASVEGYLTPVRDKRCCYRCFPGARQAKGVSKACQV